MRIALIPHNSSAFYSSNPDKARLFQGDILKAREIGLKEEGEDTSPDFWLVITKSCDLAFREHQKKTRNETFSILPLISMKILENSFSKIFSSSISYEPKNILLVPVVGLVKKFMLQKYKKDHIDSLLKNKISRFMYFPPEGNYFTEPMIIDFEFIETIDGGDEAEINSALNSKILELSSPFREKVAQRFALHFSEIGIDDEEIRHKDYIKGIKTFFGESG